MPDHAGPGQTRQARQDYTVVDKTMTKTRQRWACGGGYQMYLGRLDPEDQKKSRHANSVCGNRIGGYEGGNTKVIRNHTPATLSL